MKTHDSEVTTQERTVKARGSRKLIRISGNLTLEQLKALQDKQPPRTDQPDDLPLSELHVAPGVFQWRLENEDIGADERHVMDLVWVLENANASKPLDPIVVYPIAARFFVLDGHHRLDAYHTAGWKGPVPVEHFPGTLKEGSSGGTRREREEPPADVSGLEA